VAIVDVGKVVVEGGLSQLKELVGGDVVTLKTNSQARIAEMLRGHPSVRQIEELEDETKIVLRGTGEAAIPSFITDLGNKGVEVTSVTLQKPSLDDVFTTYTGRTLNQESPMTAPQSVRYRAKMQRREGR
jgi:ABC-2 type transport system ATP-binding protein